MMKSTNSRNEDNQRVTYWIVAATLVLIFLPRIGASAVPSEADSAKLSGAAAPINNQLQSVSTGQFAADPWTPADAFLMGGSSEDRSGRLFIRCQPYGYYDTGACLDVQATNHSYSSSRPGINSGFETGVAAIASDPDMDFVNEYNGITTMPPIITLRGVRYDARHIYPAKPLTPTEISSLHKNMWVLTNSVDKSAPQNGSPTLLPRMDVYGSYITDWAQDGSSITVAGWAVPGGGHAAKGQIPSQSLDKSRSSFTTQTAMIGVQTNGFARNTVISMNPNATDAIGNQIRAFQGEEMDVFNYGSKDYEFQFQGYTVAYRALGAVVGSKGSSPHAVRLTSDSYDMELAGPTPNLLVFNGAPDANYIRGESILVKGNGGVSGQAGSTGELFENSGFMDGVNNMRLVAWLQKDTVQTGYSAGSLHYGLTVDGHQGIPGRPQSQIVFNPQEYGTGSIALRGIANKGLGVTGSGTVVADNGVISHGPVTLAQGNDLVLQASANASGGIVKSDQSGDVILSSAMRSANVVSTQPVVFPSVTFSQLPSIAVSGEEMFCSDCLKPGEHSNSGTGMMVFNDGHAHWASTAGTIAAR